MSLTAWGWSPAWQQAYDRLDPGDQAPARVLRQDRTGYLVVHDAGESFARLSGRVREEPPAVGDWVALDLREPPTIRALVPRRTAFVRQAAGRDARAQVVAANVDLLLVVAGLDGDLNLRRLERYLALAKRSGAACAIVLNKADLAADLKARLAEVRAIASGVDVLAVSAQTCAGMDALAARLARGTTAALLGSSGVGKTSLLNRLFGEDVLPTGELRAKDGRGRHTTSARHLMLAPNGAILLDTPGMRELHLWDAEESVASVFADVEELALACRFSDCAHETEPGCAVRPGVSEARLASWRKLQREAAASARRADVAASRKEARAWGRWAKRTVEGKRERLRE